MIETHIDWESYIEPEYQKVAPKLLVDRDGYPRLYMEGRVRPKHEGWGRAVGPPFEKVNGTGLLVSSRAYSTGYQ